MFRCVSKICAMPSQTYPPQEEEGTIMTHSFLNWEWIDFDADILLLFPLVALVILQKWLSWLLKQYWLIKRFCGLFTCRSAAHHKTLFTFYRKWTKGIPWSTYLLWITTMMTRGSNSPQLKWPVVACKPLLFNCKHKLNHDIKPRTSVHGRLACENMLIGFGRRITFDLQSFVMLPPNPTHMFCQADRRPLKCSWLKI